MKLKDWLFKQYTQAVDWIDNNAASALWIAAGILILLVGLYLFK